MDRHTIKPTTVRLEPADKEAIERIKALYGCPSDIAAIRLALRMIARGETGHSTPTPNKDAAFIPMAGSQGPSAARW